MKDPKLQDEILDELKKSNELQERIEETRKEEARQDRKLSLFAFIVAAALMYWWGGEGLVTLLKWMF